MDDLVKQAMAKWPNVPHAWGWLGLDARGQWYLRDARAQAAGAFASGVPGARGWCVPPGRLREFIGRNYAVDERGQWYFQNGPQRVYVELECTPWVWRLQPDGRVCAHSGQPAQPDQLWVDEHGHAYLSCDLGLGRVHSQDMAILAEALEQGRWALQEIRQAELPLRFGYVLSPLAEHRQGQART